MEAPENTLNSHELSIVVPVYNEEAAIDIFLDSLENALKNENVSYEIVFVDDGSADGTVSSIRRHMDESSRAIKLVELTRNFGKDVALTAGLRTASGEAVIPIDVDLQDPPELIPKMLEHWRKGAKMVVPVRESRKGDSWAKRTSANLFYKTMQMVSRIEIPPNAGDFRLLDREVVDVINALPEKSRFMKGLFSWPGYSVCFLPYERAARSVGKTRWNYWRLWNFALDGIFSFSSAPLRIWTYLGITSGSLAMAYALYIVARTIIYGVDVPGYASIIVAVMFVGGLNLIGIGILGEYIGRIFEESKSRPLYLIKSVSESRGDRTNR